MMNVKTVVQDVENVEVVEHELETLVQDMDEKKLDYFKNSLMTWNHGGVR